MDNIHVLKEDDYKVFDRLSNQKDAKRGPIGWAKIYFDSVVKNGELQSGNLHHEGSNMVVAQGRQFVAQKLFTLAYTPSPDWRAYEISHFAIGAEGATASTSPPTVGLLGPDICDTSLSKPFMLGPYLNEPGGYGDSAPYGSTGAVKPIATDGSILIELESYDGGACSAYTKVKCTCVVPATEPVIIGTNSYPVSEAGLYLVSGTTAHLFSRITFAPKWKESTSVLTIVWYILC